VHPPRQGHLFLSGVPQSIVSFCVLELLLAQAVLGSGASAFAADPVIATPGECFKRDRQILERTATMRARPAS